MPSSLPEESTSALPPPLPAGLRILLTEEQLQQRIQALAAEINTVYKDCPKLVVIAILKGSFMFVADLIRHLTIPCQIEFVRLSSYENRTTSSGTIRPVDLSLPNLAGEDVLLIEDIIDTGLTLRFFKDYLQSLHQTRSLRVAVLLDKPEARTRTLATEKEALCHPEMQADFIGFSIANEFVIGYGLDFNGFYRHLPYVAVLPESSEPLS